MTHEQLTLVVALISTAGVVFTGLGALFGSWYATRTSAKQSELNALRDRVDELFAENNRLHRENLELREYIGTLRIILRDHGIEVPRFPGSESTKPLGG